MSATGSPQRQARPRPRRLTVDERAVMMLTGDEYRHAHRAAVLLAVVWWLLAAVLVLVLLGGASRTAQSVYAYTDTVRPRNAALYSAMRDRPATTWTASRAADLVPPTWTTEAARWSVTCAKRPGCPAATWRTARHWWHQLPDLAETRRLVVSLFGALLLLTPFALVAQGDMRRWEESEQAFLRREERTRRRAARG